MLKTSEVHEHTLKTSEDHENLLNTSDVHENLLKTSEVHKTYYQKTFLIKRRMVAAVNGVSLEVAPGRTLGLIGETGCGKSTLARLLVGLERPDAGMVMVDGFRVDTAGGRQLREIRRRIQLVFQDPYLAMDARMSIAQIVQEPLDNFFSLPKAERRERAAVLLKEVGLDARLLDAHPHELSGGQRQRVALARSLALLPKYLVLDEPLASLDVSVQAQILNLLVKLKEAYNLTYLFISHDLAAVQHLCDTIAVMYSGHIVELLPRAGLGRAIHPYTDLLLAALKGREQMAAMRIAPALTVEQEVTGRVAVDPGGCAFARRCGQAEACCRSNAPALQEVAAGQQVACWKRS